MRLSAVGLEVSDARVVELSLLDVLLVALVRRSLESKIIALSRIAELRGIKILFVGSS